MISMAFSEWATKQFVAWRGSAVTGRTVAEYARYIGVSQQYMSELLSGRKAPGRKALRLFAEKYGSEAFEAAGVAPEQDHQVPIDQLPARVRTRLEAAIREINATLEARGIEADSPEAVRITVEVMDRFGFTLREMENE
jgi:transcriptional regulator with XRE-family HTH domain